MESFVYVQKTDISERSTCTEYHTNQASVGKSTTKAVRKLLSLTMLTI